MSARMMRSRSIFFSSWVFCRCRALKRTRSKDSSRALDFGSFPEYAGARCNNSPCCALRCFRASCMGRKRSQPAVASRWSEYAKGGHCHPEMDGSRGIRQRRSRRLKVDEAAFLDLARPARREVLPFGAVSNGDAVSKTMPGSRLLR